jgi:hypothetical protein
MATTLTQAATKQARRTELVSVTTAERCVAFSRGVVLITALAMLEGEALVGRQPLSILDAVVAIAGVYVVGTTVLSVLGRERPGLQLPLLVADMLVITGVI